MFAPPQSGQLSVLFFLAGARAKVKPSIRTENRVRFVMTYSVTVGPGKTVAILHGGAKRALQAPPDAKAAAAILAPFYARRWTADLPADARRAIVNLGGALPEDWESAARSRPSSRS